MNQIHTSFCHISMLRPRPVKLLQNESKIFDILKHLKLVKTAFSET